MTASIYLLGGTSILGWHLAQLPLPGLTVFCNRFANTAHCDGWRRVNLDEAGDVRQMFEGPLPSTVICCASVCDVDKCEADPDWARRINVDGIRLLLEHLPPTTRLVYCSSDHVFSGDSGPYNEQSTPDPISVYGETRVAAEALVLAARPDALVVRAGPGIGDSFDGRSGHLDWLRHRQRQGLCMTVVADEYRSAVWAPALAARIAALAQSDRRGIRHVAAKAVSRPDLAMHLNRIYGIGAVFAVETRAARSVPHIGAVELQSVHRDALAAPLPSVLDTEIPEPTLAP